MEPLPSEYYSKIEKGSVITHVAMESYLFGIYYRLIKCLKAHISGRKLKSEGENMENLKFTVWFFLFEDRPNQLRINNWVDDVMT